MSIGALTGTSVPDLARDRRGVVTVEFLICFVPIFLIFLGTVQLSLLTVGKLVVRHAAGVGVRAAVVVLDDDPKHYDDAARCEIVEREDPNAGRFERGLADQLDEQPPDTPPLGGPRMADIRRAVHAPLLALAQPGMAGVLLAGPNVARALGDGPATRLLAGLAMTPVVTAVTLPVAPGSDALESECAGEGDLVTVRVTHAMPCLVPVVGRLLCKPLDWDLRKDQLRVPEQSEEARARALTELRTAPGASGQALLALSGVPFALLRAEASLPTQRAGYAYRKVGAP